MITTKLKLPMFVFSSISLIALTACSAPAKGAQRDTASPAKASSMYNNNKEISGTVTARSASGLTVGSTQVMITSSTTYVKDGHTINLDDIKVGDQVEVLATPGASGNLLALTVEVVSRNSG